MKKIITAVFLAAMALASLSGCKSGCGCHGDPYGDQLETVISDRT